MDTGNRVQEALQPGDDILCAPGSYTICGGPLASGGSALIYRARENRTGRTVLIKECFPARGVFTRVRGAIVPRDPEDPLSVGMLERCRAHLEQELRLARMLGSAGDYRLLTPAAIVTGGISHPQDPDGVMLVLGQADGRLCSFAEALDRLRSPWEDGRKGLPGIHATACLMESILIALDRFHSARDPEDPGMRGLCCGALLQEGVFLAPDGTAHMPDLGSARRLGPDGLTDLLTTGEIPAPRRFRPPEMPERGLFRMGPGTDIFSAGCLMLRCVASGEKLLPRRTDPCVGPGFLDRVDGGRIGCTGPLLRLLNHILDRATRSDPAERYPDAWAMLKDIRLLKSRSAPPTHLLPAIPAADGDSRMPDRELAFLRCAMKSPGPLFLHSRRGRFQTDTAARLAREYASPKGAYVIRCALPREPEREVMEETILRMPLERYRFLPPEADMTPEALRRAEFLDRLELLRREYAGAVLIFDRFDCPGRTLEQLCAELSFRQVAQLDLRLIFTTASAVPFSREKLCPDKTPEKTEIPPQSHGVIL